MVIYGDGECALIVMVRLELEIAPAKITNNSKAESYDIKSSRSPRCVL